MLSDSGGFNAWVLRCRLEDSGYCHKWHCPGRFQGVNRVFRLLQQPPLLCRCQPSGRLLSDQRRFLPRVLRFFCQNQREHQGNSSSSTHQYQTHYGIRKGSIVRLLQQQSVVCRCEFGWRVLSNTRGVFSRVLFHYKLYQYECGIRNRGHCQKGIVKATATARDIFLRYQPRVCRIGSGRGVLSHS
jgi:hypothetical protein